MQQYYIILILDLKEVSSDEMTWDLHALQDLWILWDFQKLWVTFGPDLTLILVQKVEAGRGKAQVKFIEYLRIIEGDVCRIGVEHLVNFILHIFEAK